MSEADIKLLVKAKLGEDFVLIEEVPGRHLIEQSPLRIDFLAFQKQHLINAGFGEFWFGIEAKEIRESTTQTKKINRLIWQCITYAQSEFQSPAGIHRPPFVLLCVNTEPKHEDHCFEQWLRLTHFAQYGNVGVMELQPYWKIRFGSCRYYGKKEGKGNVKNLGVKRYVGSIS